MDLVWIAAFASNRLSSIAPKLEAALNRSVGLKTFLMVQTPSQRRRASACHGRSRQLTCRKPPRPGGKKLVNSPKFRSRLVIIVLKHGAALLLGILLVAAGVSGRWIVEFILSEDGNIEAQRAILAVGAVQIAAVIAGLYFLVRRPKISFKDLGLSLISFVLILGVLEIGSRIWLTVTSNDAYTLPIDVDPATLRYSPHHYLNYYLTPNYSDQQTSHNSLGYRDREFAAAKPKGTFRIVVLGGSTTYTIRVRNNEKTFTRLLEEILRDKYGYQSVQVINAGVGAYTSWESLINLEFRVLDLDPDLIIIYHGTNDVEARLVPPDSFAPDNSGRRRQWGQPFIPFPIKHSYLMRIIATNLDLGIIPYTGLNGYVGHPGEAPDSATAMEMLDRNLPVYFARNLISMIAVARAHDVDVVLSTWAHSPALNDRASTPHYQRGFGENNAVVREVAANQGVKLFEFDTLMSKDKSYWADGFHVNEEGAALKAELFAKFIHDSGLIATNRE